jgi:predicted CXXCH cytochrome family protein
MNKVALLPVLLLVASAATAQQVDIAIGRGADTRPLTLFDEIRDATERRLFRELWESADAATQKVLAVRFTEQYPRSILLKEAYELAARASVTTGDFTGGLAWAKRSLRLMPENPFLLVLAADVAARQHDDGFAETSARDALRYLSNAATPEPLSAAQWPRVRLELRATAHGILGRIAAGREDYDQAERSLRTSLSLNPDNLEAAYVLAIVRMAVHNEAGAAPLLARVVRGGGSLASLAAPRLHLIYDRLPARTALSFDAYSASLSWRAPPPETAPAPLDAFATGRYAGAAACRECHAQAFDRWQSTGMAKMLRPYRAADIIGDFSGGQTVSGTARAVTDAGRHYIEIRAGADKPWQRYPVDYVIGSKWQQAYATTLPDGRFLVFPIQYSRLRSSWVNYWSIVDGPDSPRADISRFAEIPAGAVYQTTCAPCHTSQLTFPNGIERPADARFAQAGINCEMCHGPSLAHVTSMKESGPQAPAGTKPPVDFRRISAEQSVAICAQCHSQSAVHDVRPGGAANYSADDAPFYRTYAAHLPSNFSRAAFYRDGRHRATTFIVDAFTRSQCFLRGGATCASCHDPHPADTAANPTSLKFGHDADEMCLQCHAAFRDRPERHTRHAAGTEASRCVSCHMPRIMDALLFPARTHQIDDVPDAEMTARFGNDDSPNACLACHRDRDTAWLQAQMTTRFAAQKQP